MNGRYGPYPDPLVIISSNTARASFGSPPYYPIPTTAFKRHPLYPHIYSAAGCLVGHGAGRGQNPAQQVLCIKLEHRAGCVNRNGIPNLVLMALGCNGISGTCRLLILRRNLCRSESTRDIALRVHSGSSLD
jgi:hypothetical protein